VDHKTIVRNLYAALTEGRLEVVDDLLAEGYIEHEQVPQFASGRDGVRELFRALHASFTDFAMTVEDMVAEGDKVFIRCTMQGIQRAEFMGIPSLGKPMLVPVADLMRFEGGRIVEHWGLMDSGMLLQQLTDSGTP
jgi:steroid delta-isomerase-like uncharacterized protein